MTLGPGSQLGNYKVLRSLGSGGMADVYEAQDETLERTVALKVLPLEYTRNPELVARFQKEVRAAAKLNHRSIVSVFEVGQQDAYHYFSMRLLTGGDLRARIERGLTSPEALAILRELADAFAHAHARGFVHRDVKPENVMFDEQGFPVLTDFGIAKALDANTHMTRTGMTMGTPRYLAPEQANGKAVDARADLYSLGVILYEMLVGRPPYDAEESMAVIFKHVTEPIPQLPADFARLQPLLEKLMAKDPNQRIASARELIHAIDEVAAPAPEAQQRPSQVRTAQNPLLAAVLNPLRTAPTTPRPVTPPSAQPAVETGEIAVATRVAARAPVARQRAPLAPAARPAQLAPAEPAAAAAPAARRSSRLAMLVVSGLAVAGAGAWLAREAMSPALVQAPTPVPAAVDAAAGQQRLQKEKEAAALRDPQAAAQARAEARQRAAARAEARRRRAIEAEAAAKHLQGDAQTAEADAARKKKDEAENKDDPKERAQRPTGF